jgi:hypothetical protein
MNESTYEIITNELGDELITRTDSDGKVWTIPADEGNADYQAYLASLDEPSSDTE